MPKLITDLKEFMQLLANAEHSRTVTIVNSKVNDGRIKFKTRSNKTAYTLVVADASRARKLEKLLPAHVTKKYVGKPLSH